MQHRKLVKAHDDHSGHLADMAQQDFEGAGNGKGNGGTVKKVMGAALDLSDCGL